MNKAILIFLLTVGAIGLSGCVGGMYAVQGMAQSIGINAGTDIVKDFFINRAKVEEELPELAEHCDEVRTSVWSCRGASGEGDVFVVLKKGGADAIENSQRARSLVREFENSLSSGLEITQNRPLMASPVFRRRVMDFDRTDVHTGSTHEKFEGRWLVVSR